jgi:hypothetical protein
LFLARVLFEVPDLICSDDEVVAPLERIKE